MAGHALRPLLLAAAFGAALFCVGLAPAAGAEAVGAPSDRLAELDPAPGSGPDRVCTPLSCARPAGSALGAAAGFALAIAAAARLGGRRP